MKLFGNNNSSKHNASRSSGARSGKTAGNGYSKAEAEAYARKMDSRNRANGNDGRGGSKKRAGGKKKRRSGKVILIIFALLAVIFVAFAVWWKGNVKPPEVTKQKNNPKAELVKHGTTEKDDGDSTVPDGMEKTESDRREGVYTFLVLGMDDGNGNTDTIMAVTFDTVNYTMDIASIPRDTLVNVPWSVKKANTLYANYEKEGVRAAFADILGYETDFYVVADIKAFVVLINEIGGVDYDVPVNMNYDDPYQNLSIHLSKGMQHLTGEQAIGVMRYRKGYANADIGRIGTQQDFLKTVAQQIMANKDKLSISTLANVFLKYVDTDLELGNIIWLAKEFFKMDMEKMNFYTLPANYNGSVNGTSYVTIYVDEWIEMINEHLNPFKEPIVESDLDILTKNSSGTLYATSGVRAGNSSWGSGSSSSGSSSGSSGSSESGSGGDETPTIPDDPPVTDPVENDPPVEFDPENPIDEIPTDPIEEEIPTDPPVDPPVDPPEDPPADPPEESNPTYIGGGTDGEYQG
ncbi:MAG: LCP family protein [Oscillospiraceae bacterium]|nr:LCP family protein [Oscillospiraceae bacterium]